MVLGCASENVMVDREALRLRVENRMLSLDRMRHSFRLDAQASWPMEDVSNTTGKK